MEKIYESNYMTLYFHSKSGIIEEVWNSHSEKMLEEEFQKEILTTLKYMKAHQAKYYLVDAKLLFFTIPIELQTWMYQNFITPFIQLGIHHATFVMSDEMITQLSIEQTTDEESEEVFKRKFFTNKEEALNWLKNK